MITLAISSIKNCDFRIICYLFVTDYTWILLCMIQFGEVHPRREMRLVKCFLRVQRERCSVTQNAFIHSARLSPSSRRINNGSVSPINKSSVEILYIIDVCVLYCRCRDVRMNPLCSSPAYIRTCLGPRTNQFLRASPYM